MPLILPTPACFLAAASAEPGSRYPTRFEPLRQGLATRRVLLACLWTRTEKEEPGVRPQQLGPLPIQERAVVRCWSLGNGGFLRRVSPEGPVRRFVFLVGLSTRTVKAASDVRSRKLAALRSRVQAGLPRRPRLSAGFRRRPLRLRTEATLAWPLRREEIPREPRPRATRSPPHLKSAAAARNQSAD